jgi:hypothetical protein
MIRSDVTMHYDAGGYPVHGPTEPKWWERLIGKTAPMTRWVNVGDCWTASQFSQFPMDPQPSTVWLRVTYRATADGVGIKAISYRGGSGLGDVYHPPLISWVHGDRYAGRRGPTNHAVKIPMPLKWTNLGVQFWVPAGERCDVYSIRAEVYP